MESQRFSLSLVKFERDLFAVYYGADIFRDIVENYYGSVCSDHY